MEEKQRDSRLRKRAARMGYRLVKSRRQPSLDNLGGYMIVDENGWAQAGFRYDLDLDGVEDFLSDP